MSALFTPFTIKKTQFKNRIAVPPMCQYSAKDGFVNDWHLGHYAALGQGGAGVVIVEATGVSPEGRITPACLGLWSDDHIEGLSQVAQKIKAHGSVAGIQIAHAGRKASANKPWEGDDHLPETDPNAWQPMAPSALPFGANLPRTPKAMDQSEIDRVKQDFADAARRADEAGFDYLELHFAHGYLAQSFYSTHANQRTDQYGGDAINRSRFMIETLAAVQQTWPADKPLTIRLGVIEFDGNDETMLNESVELVKTFKEMGVDLISVSIGFNTPTANIPWGPAFLAPIAERVRNEAGIAVASAWNIDTPELVNNTVEQGQLDLVMVGRNFLANPHWTYTAAKALNEESPSWVLPAPYAHWLDRYKTSDER